MGKSPMKSFSQFCPQTLEVVAGLKMWRPTKMCRQGTAININFTGSPCQKKYKYPSISDQSEQGVDRRARRRWWSRGGELGSQGLGGGLNVTRMVVMVIIDDDGGQRILKMMLCSLGWGRSSGWRELSKSFWGLNHIFSIFILIHHLGFHVYPLQPKQTIMKSLKTIITKS